MFDGKLCEGMFCEVTFTGAAVVPLVALVAAPVGIPGAGLL